jgi:hypothetical protein
MIGKATLKKYDFKTIEDYFNYIVGNQINGNHHQVKQLFSKLDNQQKNNFFYFLKINELNFDYTNIF